MRAFLLLLSSSLAGYSACNRVDETVTAKTTITPRVDSAKPHAPLLSSAVRTPPSAALPTPVPRASCLVPLPPVAPPKAEKAAQCPKDADAAAPPLSRARVLFPEAPGTPSLSVELAVTPEARTRGLMYRTSMPENAGMLFSWDDAEVRGFWMRNTCIPLDMLFIDPAGFIAGVIEQVPTLNETPRSVPCPVVHVLETNAGWVRAHGVRPGMKMQIER